MANRNKSIVNYRNPCLTMHQPWASLLVYGIKRIEGRSWPSPVTGRLWIHAAGKVPDPSTIKAMEEFYKEIYALDGITDLKFPEHYPTSRLIGCVEVVGCLTREELANWDKVPAGVRLEAQTDYCWLCEQPQKLIIPFEMRGYQGVYNLERKSTSKEMLSAPFYPQKRLLSSTLTPLGREQTCLKEIVQQVLVYEGAERGLIRVHVPLHVRFPFPDPRDALSLKPGSVASSRNDSSNKLEAEKSPTLTAAIAGARAAATQFSKPNHNQSPTPSSYDPQLHQG